MIRMGKSSKLTETELTEHEEQAVNPAVSVRSDPPANAFSESELMARDIKEGRLSGFVGSGTVLTGETVFDAMLRIDGHLKGQVTSEDGTLIIGATGQVDADIKVAAAIVNGAVNGDIIASEKLTLGRSARVVGNIHAPRLIVEDGAILEGSCSMVGPIEVLEAKRAETQRQYTTGDSRVMEDAEEEPETLVYAPNLAQDAEISSDDDLTEDDEEFEENVIAASN